MSAQAQTGVPQGQPGQVLIQCAVQQLGDQIMVTLVFATPPSAYSLCLRPDSARAFAKQLTEAAGVADKTLLKPASIIGN